MPNRLLTSALRVHVELGVVKPAHAVERAAGDQNSVAVNRMGLVIENTHWQGGHRPAEGRKLSGFCYIRS